MTIRQEYEFFKKFLGIQDTVYCNKEENEYYRNLLRENSQLPAGVYFLPGNTVDDTIFYVVRRTDMSQEEISEYLQMKQLEQLRSIRSSVTFFTVLTIISLIISFISILSMFE